MADYPRENLTPEQVEHEVSLYTPFTQVVRELVDATIRTEVDEAEIRAVQAELEGLVARLRTRQLDGPYAVNHRGRHWGNTVVGVRNAVAPPLHVDRESTGRAWASFHLGAAYEGPPGLVHGGVSALVLDQMLGEATGAGGKPGMTASLTLTYRRPTRLGDLRAEAWIERSEGLKTWARAHLCDAEGVTVEAEGLFILPRWARQQTTGPTAPSFE